MITPFLLTRSVLYGLMRAAGGREERPHRNEVKSTEREKWFEVLVKDLCNTNYKVAYPDDKLQKILDLMYTSNIGRVPIVDRTDPRRIVGILSKTDIIKAIEKQRFRT